MDLIDKVVNKLKLSKKQQEEQDELEKCNNALQYMYDRLSIGKRRNKSMQEYFDMHYRGNCYYYSTYILLCMKPTDRLVRGSIDTRGRGKAYYKHGWVEFEYEGEWWVYDDHYETPIPMGEWYEMVSPYEVHKKFTQTELLNYVRTNYPNKLTEENKGDITYLSTGIIEIEEFAIPFWLIDLEIKDGEIIKFEQDKHLKEALY